MVVACCVDVAADGANLGGNGDEILSMSVSVSVLDAEGAPMIDGSADNRWTETVVEDVDEKCK